MAEPEPIQTSPEEDERERIRALLWAVVESSPLTKLEHSDRGLRASGRTPKSARTIERIIDCGLDVLARDGLRGITVEAIAAEADVNIATVYRYFDDLEAILVAMAIKVHKSIQPALVEHCINGVLGYDHRQWVYETVELSAMLRLASPQHLALYQSTPALPALDCVTEAGIDTAAELTASALHMYRPAKPYDEWLPIARMCILMATLGLDDICRHEPVDREKIEMLKEMIFNFLGPYVPE